MNKIFKIQLKTEIKYEVIKLKFCWVFLNTKFERNLEKQKFLLSRESRNQEIKVWETLFKSPYSEYTSN